MQVRLVVKNFMMLKCLFVFKITVCLVAKVFSKKYYGYELKSNTPTEGGRLYVSRYVSIFGYNHDATSNCWSMIVYVKAIFDSQVHSVPVFRRHQNERRVDPASSIRVGTVAFSSCWRNQDSFMLVILVIVVLVWY